METTDTTIRIQRAVRRKIIRRVSVVGVCVLVVTGATVLIINYRATRNTEELGVSYSDQGRDHVALTHTDTYNSNPPSSGSHYAGPANWGIYDYPVNDKIFIHNLEHGGIWIAYKPSVSPRVVDALKSVGAEFKNYKIVMAPRPLNDADIAVVAWARVYKFNLKDPDQLSAEEKKAIEVFYYARKDHGPEYVPGNMPGIDPKTVQ